MRYIDSFWEKKNLGVDSGKLVIDEAIDTAQLEEILESNKKEYWEADVACGCFDSICVLEKKGFHYMETAIGLKANISDIQIPKSMKRFVGKVSYDLTTDDELQTILDVIRSGEMFLTDKISLNSKFGHKKAGNRYGNWVESLLEKDARCFSIHYMGKLVGFEISILKDGAVEFFLGGGFPNAGAGSGMMTVTASYDYWLNQDIKSIETRVSSNNMPVLKLHELFGLRVCDMRYILVKNNK